MPYSTLSNPQRKQRAKFFMSVTLVSIFTLFSSFVILVTDATVVELACVSMNLFLFFGVFALTKVAPGFVKCRGPPIGQNKEKEEQRQSDAGSSDWCAACLIVKPARAGHCKICDRCVHRLDHHCVWLDVCIGRDNHRSFIVTLILLIVGGFWGVLRGSYYLFEVTHDEASFYGILEIIYYDPDLGHPNIFTIKRLRSDTITATSIIWTTISKVCGMALLLKQCFLITHNWGVGKKTFRQPGGKETPLGARSRLCEQLDQLHHGKGICMDGDTSTRVV
nr:palmitoyltransferase ZDHHC23-A-like [Lytechinus pictus]